MPPARETETIARLRAGRSGDAPRGALDTYSSLKRSRLEHAHDTVRAALFLARACELHVMLAAVVSSGKTQIVQAR